VGKVEEAMWLEVIVPRSGSRVGVGGWPSAARAGASIAMARRSSLEPTPRTAHTFS
jgi:hypothetical protein